MKTKADFEIGDSVVFASRPNHWHDYEKWRSGRVTDRAEDLIEVEFRSIFGFIRRKWMKNEGGDLGRTLVKRKERAEELLAKYEA